MAKFRFRLQSVLEHRAAVERDKQRLVAGIESQRAGTEAVLRAVQTEIDRENGELRESLGAGDFRDVRAHAARIGQLHADARRHVLQLSGVMARLETARAELLEAARRRKAVDLLRERRLAEWRLEESRRETAAVDELSVIRGNPLAGHTRAGEVSL